jgi:bacterioferritin
MVKYLKQHAGLAQSAARFEIGPAGGYRCQSKPSSTKKGENMKGNPTIIATLNDLLSDELTAINQYMVHSEMCADWGLDKLHEASEKRAIGEMRHAEKLIGRILFLEGTPVVSNLKRIHIGADVPAQFKNDIEAETDAVRAYNAGIRQARDLDDNGSRELLESILRDEEEHLDWLEAQVEQIKMMGLQSYLVEQLD